MDSYTQGVVPMLAYADGPAAMDWLSMRSASRSASAGSTITGRSRTASTWRPIDGLIMLASTYAAYEGPRAPIGPIAMRPHAMGRRSLADRPASSSTFDAIAAHYERAGSASAACSARPPVRVRTRRTAPPPSSHASGPSTQRGASASAPREPAIASARDERTDGSPTGPTACAGPRLAGQPDSPPDGDAKPGEASRPPVARTAAAMTPGDAGPEGRARASRRATGADEAEPCSAGGASRRTMSAWASRPGPCPARRWRRSGSASQPGPPACRTRRTGRGRR